MDKEAQSEKEKAIKLLEEAQTGYAAKSKNTLIREALVAIKNIK